MKTIFLRNLQLLKFGLCQKKNLIVCLDNSLTKYFLFFLWKNGILLGIKQVRLKKKSCSISQGFLVVFLNFNSLKLPLTSIEIVSTVQKPIFTKWKTLIPFFQTNELILLSTPLGILTHKQCLKLRLGGKVLCILH